YVYVDSLHGPLKTFNIHEKEEKEEKDEEKESSSSFDIGEYSLLLRRARIDSVQLIINDRTKDFYTQVDNFGVDASVNLSSSVSRVKLESAFSNLIVWYAGDLLVRKTSMSLDTRLLFDRDSMKLNFHKADVRLNGIDLTSTGELRQDTLTGNIKVDITASMSTPSLAEFLDLVPKSIVSEKDKISTQGSVDLDMQIKGEYGEGVLPIVSAEIKIDDAKAKYESRPLSLESVSCDAYMFFDLNNPESSYADIKRFYVNTSDIIDLDVSGKMTSILSDPEVEMSIMSTIDFDRFTEVFPLNEGVVCGGSNVSDIKAKFAVSDIMNSNYANLYIDGASTFTDLAISFDASKFVQDSSSTAYLYMKAREGNMLFGDRVLTNNDSRTMRAQVNFSGLGYKAKSGEFVSIKNIELTGGANFDRVTSEMNGFGVRGIAENTNIGVDSLFESVLERSDITIIVVPKSDHREASATLKVLSEQIAASEPTYNTNMSLSTVDMDIKAQREGEDWGMSGTVGFSDLEMHTDLFPLLIQIPNTSVRVDNRIIYLTNAEMSLGNSEFVATGYIQNFIRKIFVDPRLALNGELSIVASTLDITELMEASNNSFMLMENLLEEEGEEDLLAVAQGVVAQDVVAEDTDIVAAAESAESAESAADVDDKILAEEKDIEEELTGEESENGIKEFIAESMGTTKSDNPRSGDRIASQGSDTLTRRAPRGSMIQTNSIFLVPRRVSFIFDLNIKNALFEDAVIENVEGRAKIERGVLSLDKLTLEAIGAKAEGSMIYKNIDTRSSSVSFNMSLNGVDINRIGELMPSIATAFPMLDSFEGEVDFDLKASANLVDDAQIDITTLRSAMQFKGRNLVLMDSETFADLSKTLMFKNKDRNLIDELEAYALVDQSKIDVLPFAITIDRYSAIVGGSQTVDIESFEVDYKYNVSILKSPLPFKAGVDISGNLTDFGFKVTTAKLKNTDFDKQKALYEEYRDSIK
ncbi:MAG: AsmA-like C-terminal region-containing protein, partial [Rikenellaceae bacterium]